MSQPFPPIPPVPVVAMDDSQPRNTLKAMAIASMVIGVLSICACVYTANLWGKFYRESIPLEAAASTAKPSLANPTFAPFTEYVKKDGFPSDVRSKILQSPTAKKLSDPQLNMLDSLLTECGNIMLPSKDPNDLKAEDISPGTAELRTPIGLFYISDKTGGCNNGHGFGIVLAGDFAGPSLSARLNWNASAINRETTQLRKDFPTVTAMQAGFLAEQLSTQLQRDVTDPFQIRLKITDVTIEPGNVLSATAGTDSYFVLADGRGLSKRAEAKGLDPATGRPLTQQENSTGNYQPLLPGDYRLMHALEIYCQLTMIVAAFLIVSGIVLLITPPLGFKLQLTYAGIKFLFIASEIVITVYYIMSIQQGESSRAPFDVSAGTTGLIETVIVQSIYPIVILVVAKNKALKEYLARR